MHVISDTCRHRPDQNHVCYGHSASLCTATKVELFVKQRSHSSKVQIQLTSLIWRPPMKDTFGSTPVNLPLQKQYTGEMDATNIFYENEAPHIFSYVPFHTSFRCRYFPFTGCLILEISQTNIMYITKSVAVKLRIMLCTLNIYLCIPQGHFTFSGCTRAPSISR